MWRNPHNWIGRLFFSNFPHREAQEQAYEYCGICSGVLKGLWGQTDICWWSKCIWSLLSARGSRALSQSFVPMILQNTGLCKTQAHGMAPRTDEEGSLYAECSPKETWSSKQRNKHLLCKWTVLLEKTLVSTTIVSYKKEIACRTLNFRSEKGIALTSVRLTLQETEQVLSLEVILYPYTAPFLRTLKY